MSPQLILFLVQAGFGLFTSVMDGDGIILDRAGIKAGARNGPTIPWS